MKTLRYLLIFGLLLALGSPPILAQTFQTLGSASLSVTNSTGNVALPAGKNGNNITIQNVGGNEAFVNFGIGSGTTAATTNESVPAGAGRCFQQQGFTYVAGITAASTTTLRISQGSGPCSISFRGGGSAAGLTVGASNIAGGTDTRVLFDNAGLLGEYAISGTGSVCMTTSCSMTTPILGTPTSGIATNLTGTAAGLTAGTVTTNANLTGPITSTGNATAIASQTGTGTKFVVDTTPTLVTPVLGVATGTSIALGGCTIGANSLCGAAVAFTNLVASGYGMFGSATALTLTAGAVGMQKITASGSAPGAAGAKLEVVCGTNAGTAKLIIAAGTSATAVTVADNVGAGVTGC